MCQIEQAESAAHLPAEVSAGLTHLQKLQSGRPTLQPGLYLAEDHAAEIRKP
jgi:hypothetical protein